MLGKRLCTATATYRRREGDEKLIERHTFTGLRVFAAVLPPSRVPPLFIASRRGRQASPVGQTNNLVTARYRAVAMLTQLLRRPASEPTNPTDHMTTQLFNLWKREDQG